MNALRYSLIISVSAHAFLLIWLTFTVPPRNNRVSHLEVALMSPPPSLSKSEGSSPVQQTRQLVNRNQPAVIRRPLTSRNTGAPPESLENLAQSAEPLAVDGGTAPFSASDASTLGDQAGDIAIGSGSAVSVPEDGGAGTKGATSGRDGSSRDSASALAGSSRKSSTSSEIDSASGAVIPGYVIDAAGYRPPDAGAIYPEVDKYVLYGADKRTAIKYLVRKFVLRASFYAAKKPQ